MNVSESIEVKSSFLAKFWYSSFFAVTADQNRGDRTPKKSISAVSEYQLSKR